MSANRSRPTSSGAMSANYNMRAEAYRNLGQPQRAIEDLEEAINFNPKRGAAYRSRALSYTMLSMDQEAVADLQKAVELGVDRATLEEEIKKLKEER